MSGFPDPESRYHVCATYDLAGGRKFTAFIAGPFEHPDQARQAREQVRRENTSYTLHCVEVLDAGGAE